MLTMTGKAIGGGGSSAPSIVDFDVPAFEQRLRDLKDTQDSIQQLSAWCLQRRIHHKKIVTSWLNVLKQVKVESRLTLFYLANDVIQYSKRKHYEYVDSWGTYLQKATTMVRDEKVKHKIMRIFKIWEQREIYNDEFLADLNGLLSATSAKKSEPVAVASSASSSSTPTPTVTMATGPTKLAENKQALSAAVDIEDFQTASLVNVIKECVKNEHDTDNTFKSLNKTPIVDVELAKNSIKGKDRKRVEDIEREIEQNLVHYQTYVHSLKTELNSRRLLLTLLEQAETFYHNQRGEVKVVANAYRNFGNRLKSMKKKLDELTTTLPSPIPSPDVNAPSPEPDADLQLPDEQNFFNMNGMMNSYMDGNLPFDISDFRRDSPTTNNAVQPIQVINSRKEETEGVNDFLKTFFPDTPSQQHYGSNRIGPPGPPAPPQSIGGYVPTRSNNSAMDDYGNTGGGVDYRSGLNSYGVSSSVIGGPSDYGLPSLTPRPNNHHPIGMGRNFGAGPGPQYNQPMLSDYSAGRPQPGPRGSLLPPPPPINLDRSDEYNSTWDMSMTWDGPHDSSGFQNLDTPVSPPHYERKGMDTNVIEYIDGVNEDEPLQDVDHRQLPNIALPAFMKEKGRLMDVDHRNLISLTGSPGPLLKSSLDDLEDIDDDDDDADILLMGVTDSESSTKKEPTPVKARAEKAATSKVKTKSYWDNYDDLNNEEVSLDEPEAAPVATSSSSATSVTTTYSEPKDLDMRIQSMQNSLNLPFEAADSAEDAKSEEGVTNVLPSLLLQTPTSLLEIDDFLQNFERENFDLSKPPTVLMSNQTDPSPSPSPSLSDVMASTPRKQSNDDGPQDDDQQPSDNNESVDMDLSDEEYVPEYPTDSSPVIQEGSHDSTEPYEPFEGEEVDEALMVIPALKEPTQNANPPAPQRPALLPDPEFPPSFAFQQQQQQQEQRKHWDLSQSQLNNFGNNVPGLTDLTNFGDFPNLAAGLNNLNQPQGGGMAPPFWNNQMGPMGPFGSMDGQHFGSPNRPPFGGPLPFNNNNKNNFRNNNWGGRGPRPNSPYFRGGMGRGGPRGNFRGGPPKFRGGGHHNNNNMGGHW